MPISQATTRRRFLQSSTATAAAGLLLPSPSTTLATDSANDRPVFATIGLRNQGWAITQKTLKFADFVALADVDSNVLGTNAERIQQRQDPSLAGGVVIV